MNTKGNKRFEEMQNKIDYAFLKLIREHPDNVITVSQICATANIHRTTFYGHYVDVYDLMENLTTRMYKKILGFFLPEGENVNMGGFVKLFELVGEQKDFFSYYLRNRKSDADSLQLFTDYDDATMEKIMEIRGYQSKEELAYHQIFFCEGLVAMIRRWIATGCKESPEEMSDMLRREYMLVH